VVVAIATVALAALTGPSAACARSAGGVDGQEVFKGLRYRGTEEVPLPASNGYRITILARAGATPSSSSTGHVELIAERGSERNEYLARGQVTSTNIKVSFGKLGEVALRFQPSGGALKISAGETCSATHPSVIRAEQGIFTGTAHFNDGYTELIPGGPNVVPGAHLGDTLKPPLPGSRDGQSVRRRDRSDLLRRGSEPSSSSAESSRAPWGLVAGSRAHGLMSARVGHHLAMADMLDMKPSSPRYDPEAMNQRDVRRYDPSARAAEKQASRDADACALSLGLRSEVELRRENGLLALPHKQINVDFAAFVDRGR
jgi:hypothetical protein